MTEENEPEEEPKQFRFYSNATSSNVTGNTISSASGFAYYPCSACGTYGLHNCTGYTYYPYYTWYTNSVKRCPYCDAISHHEAEKCSRVKSIKYHEDGKIKAIKFHKDA